MAKSYKVSARKMLLVGHLSDTNLGDAAIVAGTTRLLRRAAPGVSLGIVPTMPANTLRDRDTAICRREGLTVHAPLCALPVREVSPERGALLYAVTTAAAARGALVLVAARVAPSLARRLLRAAERPTFDAFRAAELIVLEGGSSLRAERRTSHVVHVWRLLHPVLLALALRKRVIGLGHSIGPIEGGLPGRLLVWGLRRNWTIYARDRRSQELLRELTGRNAGWVPDVALAIGVDAPARNGSAGRVALSVRPLDGRTDAVARRLVGALLQLEPRPRVVTLTANAFGPSPKQDDRPVLDGLEALLREGGFEVERADCAEPEQARALYSTCDLVLGVRMHASILARLGGTPSLPLEYEGHKAAGVFAYLAPGLEVPSVHDELDAEARERLRGYLANGLPDEERDALADAAALLEHIVAEIVEGKA